MRRIILRVPARRPATATDFCATAIEHNVLTMPGGAFSERDTHFRVSYATTDEKLPQGCVILCGLV
jgi:aspartate/methionine/tyrosine aminotransferase